MRAETAAYREERRKYVTSPNAFLRVFHVPSAASAQEWAFSRDFAARTVLNPTVEKLRCLRRIVGNTQTVDPIAGSSSIGSLTLELVNLNREMTRYVADPALPLSVGLSTELSVRFDHGAFVATA